VEDEPEEPELPPDEELEAVEPLDELEPPSLFAGAVLSDFFSDLVSDFAVDAVDDASPPSPPLFFGDEEYRSAYQPPPLRMKFPPEI
jgi:hypothetical protein